MTIPDIDRLRACLRSREFQFIRHVLTKKGDGALKSILNFSPHVQPDEIARLQGDIRTYGHLVSPAFTEEVIAICQEEMRAEEAHES